MIQILIHILLILACAAIASVIMLSGAPRLSFGETLKDKRFVYPAASAILIGFIISSLIAGESVFRLIGGQASGSITYQQISLWYLGDGVSLVAALAVGAAFRLYFGGNYDRYNSFKIGEKRRGRHAAADSEFEHPARSAKGTVLIIMCVSLMLVIAGVSYGASGSDGIKLQEICRRKDSGAEKVSYVVLRNDGSCAYSAEDLYISTDEKNLMQYNLGELSVPSHGDRTYECESAKFVEIKKSGGTTLYLSTGAGEILDSVLLPEMPSNTAYKLSSSGWENYALPTAKAETESVAVPAFSAESGFYDSAFDLTLSADSGAKIYYTLDGSVPDASSTPYTEPIHVYDRSSEPNKYRSVQNVQREYLDHTPVGTTPVDKAFVVRAVAVDSDGSVSKSVTQTYFINKPQYKDSTVISLVADPDDLFGENGIYVTGKEYDEWYKAKREAESEGKEFKAEEPTPNFLMRGAKWERLANFEMFDASKNVIDQPVGIRVQGKTAAGRTLKRFSVYSRKDYSGSRLFDASLFGSDVMTHSMMFREGFDNAFSLRIAEGRNVATPNVRAVSVFVDGEYWYDTFIQDKYNESFFEEKYGLSRNDTEIIKIGYWSDLSDQEKANVGKLYDSAENSDLSISENYSSLCKQMDVQSYIDYVCINLYLANADTNDQMNNCLWRSKVNELSEYGDGRWRWGLWDMDLNHAACCERNGYTKPAEINSFVDHANLIGPLCSGSALWESLMNSQEFRKQFVLTFMDLLNTNFSIENVTALLNEMGKDISYDNYFYRDRAGYITKYMEEELELTGTQETLTLQSSAPDAGSVKLNTISPDLSGGSWQGKYYTDYPVTLTARPNGGHSFSGWEVNGKFVSSDATINVQIERGGTTVRAIFK